MTKIPYIDSPGNISVKVELNHATDVFLVDSNNYRKMNNGQKFKYHGGHYTHSPVTISVSGIGRWYLIVKCRGPYRYTWYR